MRGAFAALLLLCSGCASALPAPPTEPAASLALPATCSAGPDADGDGVADACELMLAQRFAPVMMLSPTRCTPPVLSPRPSIPGGYFHGVQPVRGAVRLVYLPAYYRDCGWTGAKCRIADCAPHEGDSEIIALDVVPADTAWRVQRIFLSAHCLSRIRGDCRWYEGEALGAFTMTETGAPVVWVADGRQANYPSREACERGHMRIDTCAADAVAVAFPVNAARNIGSRTAPLHVDGAAPGCVSGAWVEPHEPLLVSHDVVECFFDAAARFTGWQGGTGVTGYGRYLEMMEF